MTLTAEMSKITRAMGNSHTERTREIDEMKHALQVQISDGRASVRRASSTLNDAIGIELRNISRHVAATRSSASGLIKRYKAARQASTKALKARLGADRTGLAVMVKKVIHGLELDRVGAARIFRDFRASRQPKVKVTSPVITRAPVISPAVEAAKTVPVVAAPAVGGVQQK